MYLFYTRWKTHLNVKILVNVESRELTFGKLQIILKVYTYLSLIDTIHRMLLH